MIGLIFNTSEIDLCKDQSEAISKALESMPESVTPIYDAVDYTYIKYHPTQDLICLPLELDKFEQWKPFIESVLTRSPENITEDWNETNEQF